MTAKRPVDSSTDSALPQPAAGAPRHDLAVAMQHEAPIPLASKAVFWQPRYLAASAALVHLPFLFWLVETVRPASVVQLGLRDGVGFMGLCQGIDKLGLDAVCMGVQPAGEDAVKLADKVPEKMLDSHGALYGDFSFIVKEDMGRAARHMRRAQVDMLVIDMPVDAAFLTSLKAHWEPVLSDHAVIVLHDAARNFASKEAEKFYDQLIGAHPAVSFPQADCGLDVVLYGAQQPERLTHLAQLELGDQGYLSARNVFARLGQGLEHSQQARSRGALLDKAKAALKEAEARAEQLKAAHGPLQDMVRAAEAAEEAQVAETAVLQAQIFDLGQELAHLRAKAAAQDDSAAQIARLQNELVQEHDRHKALTDRCDTLEAALVQEQKKRKEHWTKLESATADKAALADRLQAAEARGQTAEQELATLAAAKAALDHKLAAQQKAHADEMAKMQAAYQDKLRSGQEKRLVLWEAHEALKREHQALLRRKAPDATLAVAQKQD